MDLQEKQIKFLTTLVEDLADTISQIMSLTGDDITPEYIISQYSKPLKGTTAIEYWFINQGKLSEEEALKNSLKDYILKKLTKEIYNNDT